MAHPLPLPSVSQWDDSLFDTVMATAINGIIVLSERGLIRAFNPACEQIFHYQREEVIGHTIPMLLASPYREEYEDNLREFQKTGVAVTAGKSRELTAQRKDGTSIPIFMSVGEGSLHRQRIFVVVVQDLTHLNLERAVHAEQRAFLAAIVDASNDAIVSKTLDGKITSWNKAAERMFGYSAEEMIGTPITKLFPDDRISEEFDIVEKLIRGEGVQHYETVRVCRDGRHIDVSVTVSPIRDANSEIIGASKTIRDITERKVTQERLQTLSNELSHVARVGEMGQVSAAIAHELNQPLTAMLNYTNVAKRLIASTDSAARPKAYEAVSKAGEQAIRAGQIIRRLRDFVEKRESTRTVESINAIAEDAVALGLIGTRTADVKAEIMLAESIPPVLVDRVQIQQVLVNLLRNAVEAMAESPKHDLTLTTGLTQDGEIAVTVADTGPGVPEELASKLFRPFVTTKPGGMGIGLAISRTIIEAHGGRLEMRPNIGGGTVFQFTLPPANPTEH